MEYLLFVAKLATVVVALLLLVLVPVLVSRRGRRPQKLLVTNLNRKYEDMARAVHREILPHKEYKRLLKTERHGQKLRKKQEQGARERPRVFVLNFRGDLRATAVAGLREEITAVLMLATPRDEVVLRLENAGGLVHEHGLAASQLARIRERGIPLTVAVDKVAASGGYLMACVADRILAAPFAIVGSIGVLTELPNFHRFLQRHGIDFEVFKAGDLKRTVTLFGKNSEEDRMRMQEHLRDTHDLFKNFVARNRPQLDVAAVSTGEYWHGTQAVELKLVDEVCTSDDYLLAKRDSADLYEVSYLSRKGMRERVMSATRGLLEVRE